MKKAFKTWWVYLIAFILDVIITLIAAVPYACKAKKWDIQIIYIVYLFSGVLIIFIAFVIQDIYRARIRHKTKNWSDKLPEETLTICWQMLLPALIGGAVSLLIGSIISFII